MCGSLMFTSIEAVDNYLANEKLECLICGKSFSSLHKHVFRAHGLKADEYKAQFGIPYSRGLVGTKMRKKLSEAASELHDKNPEHHYHLQENRTRKPRREPPKYVTENFTSKSREYAELRRYSFRQLCLALLKIKSGVQLKDLPSIDLPSQQTLKREAEKNEKFKTVFERAKYHQIKLRENRVIKYLKSGLNQTDTAKQSNEGIAFVRRIKKSINIQ